MSEQPRKSELEASQQTVKFFETLLRASTDGIVITDAMQNIVVVNEAFCAFLGRRWRDVIETSLLVWIEQLDADAPRRWAELEQRVHLDGACRDVEFGLVTKDGVRRLSVNASLLERVADEEVGVIISIWRDITERVRAEETLRESEEKFRMISASAQDAIVMLDNEGKTSLWNEAAERMFGYSDQEVLGKEFHLFPVPQRYYEAYRQGFAKFKTTGQGAAIGKILELTAVRKDGTEFPVALSLSAVKLGGKWNAIGIVRDITERKRAEEERERLLVAERKQRLLAETLAEVTLAITSLMSHEAVLDEILRQVQRIAPYSTANIALWEGDALRVAHWRGYEAFGGEELISSLVQTLDDLTVDLDVIQSRQPLVIPDTHQEPRWVVFDETSWIRSYLAVPICLHDQVLGLLRLDGDTPGEFSAEDGERLRPLANVAAIALENAQLFGEVQRLAITDGLTGTYNRRHFFELAEHELNRVRRFGQPVSAIMLDLDHFKQVNDTYGHAVGDQVLRSVAERCGESIRDIDILGRYGGEEFAVILPATGLSGAHNMAERLRRYIADVPIPTDKGDLTVTISLGVASNAHDDGDVAALLNRADAAMYAAKQAGRNCVAVI